MWLLYQLLYALALAVSSPFLLWRRGRHYLATVRPRWAASPGGQQPVDLWLHAVSVGEVAVAATLARGLPADLRLLVTTITPTGQARAEALFAGRAQVAYLPFDLRPAIGRFLRRFAPRALVLIEGDYWPLLLHEARRRALPVAVVNGRVSDRSFARLRRLRCLLAPLFGPVARFGMQTPADAERLRSLGVAAERLAVTGNLKFESPLPPPLPALEADLARLADGRPIFVAGSTMAGEEEAVLAALAAAGPDRALLLLAPRHPERWPAVFALAQSAFPEAVRRSALPDRGRPPLVLLDSLGELAALYRIAAGAFIGGTLVATGGHNPLEPARFGVPVAVGPSMENFREIAERFDRAAAWRRVRQASDLSAVFAEWLADPEARRRLGEKGRALIEENRGALAESVALVARATGLFPPPVEDAA